MQTSTTLASSMGPVSQTNVVLGIRAKKQIPVDFFILANAATRFDTKKSDAPQLTCRLPHLGNRAGRCYELAYRGCSKGKEWTVVHGETIGPWGIGRMGHAWLENNGWVYDPVLDRTMSFDAYALLVRAVVLKRFTVCEMYKQTAECGHYGPW